MTAGRRPFAAWGAILVAGLLAVPILVVAAHVFLPGQGAWQHVARTLLGTYVGNTLLLALGTGTGVFVLGLGSAWLVASYRFPLHKTWEWALVLPLAFPGYVIAYAYTDFLQVSGPVQTWIREATGLSARDYWFPPVRSLGGAIVLLSLVLYPYVYLLARATLIRQSAGMLDAARSLGCTRAQAFRRVALPMARPALASGVALALMETLADFGTVSYFGVPVLTTGIYRAWFSLGDPVAAAKLSAALLAGVLLLLLLELRSRGKMRFADDGGTEAEQTELTGWRGLLASVACAVPVVLGFLLPAGILLHRALVSGTGFSPRYLDLLTNTLGLAFLASALVVCAALVVAYGRRLDPAWAVRAAHRTAGLGYAVPGSVVAVGVLIPLAFVDHSIVMWFQERLGQAPALVLTGSVAGLLYAYLVRFLSVALQTLDAGLARITPSMDAAARSLGATPGGVLKRVHAPMLRPALFTAALIVFVEVMKELPATVILRPFNFETLAVYTYHLAADERLTEAATPALTIVLAGLIPVLILSRQITRRTPARRSLSRTVAAHA